MKNSSSIIVLLFSFALILVAGLPLGVSASVFIQQPDSSYVNDNGTSFGGFDSVQPLGTGISGTAKSYKVIFKPRSGANYTSNGQDGFMSLFMYQCSGSLFSSCGFPTQVNSTDYVATTTFSYQTIIFSINYTFTSSKWYWFQVCMKNTFNNSCSGGDLYYFGSNATTSVISDFTAPTTTATSSIFPQYYVPVVQSNFFLGDSVINGSTAILNLSPSTTTISQTALPVTLSADYYSAGDISGTAYIHYSIVSVEPGVNFSESHVGYATVTTGSYTVSTTTYNSIPNGLYQYAVYINDCSANSVQTDTFATNGACYSTYASRQTYFIVGTTSVPLDQVNTSYTQADQGYSQTATTTSFGQFLNLPYLLQTRAPFAYFFQVSSILKNLQNTSAYSTTTVGAFSWYLPGYGTSTVDLFSPTTVNTLLPSGIRDFWRGIMVAVTYMMCAFYLFRRSANIRL